LIGGDEMVTKAKSIVDRVISAEELATIAEDKKEAKRLAREFDYFIAEAPLMPLIGKRLGVVLGPRGKMPKPIPPGSDPKPMVDNLRRSVFVRSRDRSTFHAPVGNEKMSPEQIAENIDMVIRRVSAKLERGMMNIDSAYVKTSMGPAVRVI